MTYGEVAYEAYCQVTGYRSLITGDNLPEFKDLHEPIKRAWASAAEAVMKEFWRRTHEEELREPYF